MDHEDKKGGGTQRALRETERLHIQQVLEEFQATCQRMPFEALPAGYSVIDGSESNIEILDGIAYEGLGHYVGQQALDRAFPFIVLNVLVESQGCEWIMVQVSGEWQFGVTHKLLPEPITVSDLVSGEWLGTWDFDEPPDVWEILSESYEELLGRFAKARISGSSKVRGRKSPRGN